MIAGITIPHIGVNIKEEWMASINPAFVRAAILIKNYSEEVWGTGFCFAYISDYSDIENAKCEYWFVTCAHVIDAIEEHQAPNRHIDRATYININQEEGPHRYGFEYSIPSGVPIVHEQYWIRHKEWIDRCSRLGPISKRPYTPDDAVVDIAVARGLDFNTYKKGELDWWGFPPKTHLFKSDLMILSEGDEVFIIGFPTGFEKDNKNWPVVRQGVLAQIQPYLQGKAGIFLIDGSVFGGNSGGPVVTKATVNKHRWNS